jgi:putative glutamine amidotransferase
MKPIIGITQDVEKKNETSFYAYLDNNYAQAVYNFGGLPVMIPILADDNSVKQYAGMIDGLLLSGGDDIHPRYYGAEIIPECLPSLDKRTDYDFALIREVLALGKPIFGICLGAQELNVYYGGTLHQDIPNHKATDRDVMHDVILRGAVSQIASADRITVNSFHHQAIDRVGKGLEATAVSIDNTIEAVEISEGPLVFGVQWHPERMQDDPHAARMFRVFMAACAEKMK